MCVRGGSSAGGIAAGSCVPILWVEEAIVMTLARLRLSVADAAVWWKERYAASDIITMRRASLLTT
jgi:hypothetical protein